MEDVVNGSVSKGGECWLELSIERRSKGVEIWVRVHPKVEEFIRSLAGDDPSTNTLEEFGAGWFSVNPQQSIRVVRLVQDVDSVYYNLNTVGGSIGLPKGGANIAFLRFVGVGSSEGIKFGISGPISRDYIRAIKDNVLASARQLFRDYIAPIHINLRISSTEL